MFIRVEVEQTSACVLAGYHQFFAVNKAGVPLVTVSDRAGHTRTSTTTDIYSHFIKSSDKDAADKLDSIFG